MKLYHFFIVMLLPCMSYSQKPEDTEKWTPVPVKIDASIGFPPSDAIILFDGKNLEEWLNENGKPANWIIENNTLTVKPGSGSIKTKRKFADCQLHIEWLIPLNVTGEGQGRGNSGVFLQERYEVQILDSYENKTYVNGQAGAIYKQGAPLVNASAKPGEWQVYDIIFTAPKFNSDGLKSPAFVTVLHNGIIIQNHFEIKGTVAFIGEPRYEKHDFEESLLLQDHGNPVSFRNIWIRKL